MSQFQVLMRLSHDGVLYEPGPTPVTLDLLPETAAGLVRIGAIAPLPDADLPKANFSAEPKAPARKASKPKQEEE